MALFMRAKRRKQSKCLPANEFINYMYSHLMEYYSAIKKSGVQIHIITVVDLENIMLMKGVTMTTCMSEDSYEVKNGDICRNRRQIHGC
jgi:hypothetical protein